MTHAHAPTASRTRWNEMRKRFGNGRWCDHCTWQIQCRAGWFPQAPQQTAISTKDIWSSPGRRASSLFSICSRTILTSTSVSWISERGIPPTRCQTTARLRMLTTETTQMRTKTIDQLRSVSGKISIVEQENLNKTLAWTKHSQISLVIWRKMRISWTCHTLMVYQTESHGRNCTTASTWPSPWPSRLDQATLRNMAMTRPATTPAALEKTSWLATNLY